MQEIIFFLLSVLLCNVFVLSKAQLVGHRIRIVGENEFPSVACIAQYSPNFNLQRTLICSGTLISESHVLTAEHCFNGLETNVLQILIGPGEFLRSTAYYGVWWVGYNDWVVARTSEQPEIPSDIAIIKLQGNLPRIRIGFIFRASSSLIYGLEADLLGCGLTNAGTIGTHVTTSKIKILSYKQCEKIASTLEQRQIRIPPSLLCTRASPYVFLERGDSGGPLIFFGTVVGVNVGTCPIMNGQFDPSKVNTHALVETVIEFIDTILALEH